MTHYFESGFIVSEDGKDTGWHTLATPVVGAPSVKEAIPLAGLDWRVLTVPLTVKSNGLSSLSLLPKETGPLKPPSAVASN